MADYWGKRQAKTQEKLTNKSIKETEEQLIKYYNRTMKRVIADFEATYDKLQNAVEDGKQPTPADLHKLSKFYEMQGQIKNELQRLGDKQNALLSKQFEQQYLRIYEGMALKSGATFNTANKKMAQQMINTIWCADGKSWSSRIWKNTEELQQALNDGLIECVVTGKKTSDLKAALIERFNVSYNRADALVRTEMAHIQTQAAQQRYKDYGIKEVEVFVDEDERTCPVCAKHEGERYGINERMPVPFHPRCRCCMIPVIEETNREDEIMKEEYERKLQTIKENYPDALKKEVERVNKDLMELITKPIIQWGEVYAEYLKETTAEERRSGGKQHAREWLLNKMNKNVEKAKENLVYSNFIYCVECGKPIPVDGKKTNAVKRCAECQEKYRKKYKALKEKERRARKKNNNG